MRLWGHFLLQGNSCVLLGNFCLSHIGKMSSPFLPLVRCPPPFNHWFMPYKVERGRTSFQCGTSKNCLGVHMSFLEAKNAPTIKGSPN